MASTRKPDRFDAPWFESRLRELAGEDARQLLVAVSGGLDSMLLLALAAALPRDRWSIRAVHVHHHLQSAADAAARLCRAECRRLGVPLHVRHVQVGRRRGESLEALARERRYAACAALLRRGELLLTAHHDDDQLETLLLQLMRGAGVAGLAAMPQVAPFARGWHLRPLLGTDRAGLAACADERGLRWVDDASNADPAFDRNFLRAEVLPRLRSRWPAAATVAARSAAHLGEARGLLDELADADLAAARVGAALRLDALRRLSAARQRNALRRWIAGQGLGLPDRVHLERIRLELGAARRDAVPEVRWGRGIVRRHRGCLYASPPENPAPVRAWPRRWRWRRDASLDLGPGWGRLRVVPDAAGPVAWARLPAVLTVAPRAGGESLRLEPDGPRRALKDLLREAGVLPWWRAKLPIVTARKRVVSVAGLWSDAAFRGGPRTRRRARIIWEPDT